jgi:hypothetical protein
MKTKWQNYPCAVLLTADYVLNVLFIGAGITICATANITAVILNQATKPQRKQKWIRLILKK